MRFPRVIVALLLALSFAISSVPLDAAKGSKGAGQSSAKGTPRPKTVHVKEYKNDQIRSRCFVVVRRAARDVGVGVRRRV